MVGKDASNPGLQTSSDEEALAAEGAPHGTATPLEELVAGTYADVWRLCSALVEPNLADDLAQETFLRASTALHRFRGSASRRTWLFAIARHVCMDELRARHRRRRRDERLEAAADRSSQAADPSGEVATAELLGHLDSDRRAAFVLTQIFRLSYEDAAAVCNCPTGTIRSRVARARDDLITLMCDDRGGPRKAGASVNDDARAQGSGANV